MVGIAEMIQKIGTELYGLMNSTEALYGVYLIAFFFGIWVMINSGLQKLEQFKGKPAKVISTAVSIMVTGAIFYSKGQGPEAILELFHGFIGFILILALALSIGGYGIYAYVVKYKKEDKMSHTAAMLILSVSLYIASTLMIPFFASVVTSSTGTTFTLATGYIGSRTSAFDIFGSAFLWTQSISMLLIVIYTFKLLWDTFLGDESQLPLKSSISSESETERKKHISDYKHLLNSLLGEMKHINDIFTDKINLLNEMRRRHGGL